MVVLVVLVVILVVILVVLSGVDGMSATDKNSQATRERMIAGARSLGSHCGNTHTLPAYSKFFWRTLIHTSSTHTKMPQSADMQPK
jgi:hypothetical protein